jgi:low temperature requirement protein LtrA
MLLKFIFYSIAFFPIITRGILYLNFPNEMKDTLSKEELDKESHRTHILTLAGFSFSGLLAIVVLDVALRQDFHFSIYYLLMSFLGYLVALNLQSYKAKRWEDQIATAFMDIASLCLILSVLSILISQKFSPGFAYPLSILAISIWLIDHWLRLRFQWKYLKEKGEKKGD